MALDLSRAIDVARARTASAPPRALFFRVAGQTNHLPLAALQEVVFMPVLLARVPRAPTVLLGVMNLRGRVVPVLSVADSLADGPSDAGAVLSDSGAILVVRHGRREVGLFVEAVDGIGESPESPPLSLEKVLAGADAARR